MKTIVLLFSILISLISCDNYAVLVAGSHTYTNYRHQSDVFHFYQILKSRGIKPENIIVFAYDDIAYAKKNPFPGQIFNSPKGVNVYDGVVIDYYAEDVTPENYLAVLEGDADAINAKDPRTTKKVLTTTEEDNVFLYFSDHGSDGLISFPNKYLYADELFAALNIMYEKKMYKELVFYVEACYSGSLFRNILPANMSIYTTTAANHEESSYAEYCSYDAKVNDTFIGSCLGDEYSCRVMEDIDSRPGDKLKEYTMQQQYEYLVKAVKESHVMQFGDLEIAEKSIFEFINEKAKKVANVLSGVADFILPSIEEEEEESHYKISNENYRLEWFRMQAEQTNDLSAEEEYYEEILQEGRSTKIFQLFKKKFNLPKRNFDDEIDYDCYRKVVEAYSDKCGMLIDRDFKFMTHIANFCTMGINSNKAISAFAEICG